MHLRTRHFAAAALMAAAAVYFSGHVRADQDNAPGRSVANAVAHTNKLYIVQMIDVPVVSYTGGIPGQPATKPNRGQKIDPLNPTVVSYAAYLDTGHNAALARVGGGRKVYDYHFTFNGFAAELTEAQAEALRQDPAVLAVTKDEEQFMDTSSTPAFLGLSNPGGLWDQLGGIDNAGDGIIIGVIDSGIWPESLSFSDRTGTNGNATKDGKLSYRQLPGWHGKCTPGEAFNASMCNEKLIGAQYFNAARGGDEAVAADMPWEFTSVRDYNGHGTHTASTAAGNHGVAADGAAAAFGSISGMAPHARIAAYKALWSTENSSTAGGFSSDLVAAIDQAVADGVDVINYSISGSQTNFLDPAQVAFLFAADAGIFVSASAGNSGPNTGTVAHPGPWLTTVAAGTHNRDGVGSVTLGNSVTYNGASVATSVGPAPLIDSMAAGVAGADPTALQFCFSKGANGGTAVLDPAKVAGKIVVCDRGIGARIDKSNAVLEAGGVGMILTNAPGFSDSINADFHAVPSVHLRNAARADVRAYAALSGATAKINQATIIYTAAAPFTASFSSRGPLTAGGGDLLKPDVIAPGQDILAAVSPFGVGRGRLFDLYSGTSMSAPHVAGLAALLKQRHPDWSPMAIKSALMTTAFDVLDSVTTATRIFRQGAGHVAPNSAADPGLVYDASFNDWLAFLCGTTTGVRPSTCAALATAGYSLDPSDMNVASIAIGDLADTQTIKRRVTNVGGGPATYTASFTGMSGFTVTVSPASLTLAPGQTASYSVTFTRTTATLASYTGGQLTWTDGTHTVRSPMVVRPVALVAPATVSGTGAPINYAVKFGYTGAFTATPRGLVAATTTTGSVGDDPADNFTITGQGVTYFDVAIPAGTTYARFSLFNANVSPASDLDLYVYKGTTRVGASGGGEANEEVNLLNPAEGTYRVYVHGFAVPAAAADFTAFHWLLGSTDAGNMAVSAPAAAVQGASGTVSLTFSGLAAGQKYLGSVAYSGTAGLPNPTIVRVDK